jgi:electron transport complex protein RnfD
MPESKGKSTLPVISSAPHIKEADGVNKIMWTVVIALLPNTVYAVYIFGVNAAVLLTVSVVSAILSEFVFQKSMKRPVKIMDGSAVITGLLVAMNVPPHAPAWMAAIGSAFAIVIVKQLFGGIGFNIFNPALAGRAFMMASWPVYMTTSWHRFPTGNIIAERLTSRGSIPQEVFDVITQATPLTALKESSRLTQEYNISIDNLLDYLISSNILESLFIGNIGGCIGETSALLILLGGLFLMWRRVITWHIPVSFIGTVAAVSYFYYYFIGFSNPGFVVLVHILSGGVFLGAFFMATDMVTSPVSVRGMVLFGIGCGLLTFTIRVLGGYPEGVSYSILLMNATVPLIDRFTKPEAFGVRKERL